MVNTCTRILGIAPYEGMQTTMNQAAQAYPDIQLDVFTGDLDAGVSIVQRIPPNTYDCIISRGGTAELIRKVTDLPVVEVQISIYDVLGTMKLAENYSNRYAIVGFPSITETAHILCDLLNYNLEILTVHSADEAEQVLDQLKNAGCRMVICDMVTHRIARRLNLDAFLITSGAESLHTAIDQAINLSLWFRRLRQENLFLRSITQDQNGRIVVLDKEGAVFYSSPTEPPENLLESLRTRLREVPSSGSVKFYHTELSHLYSITAQTLLMDSRQYCLFYCIPSRIPLHTHWTGIRAMNKGECEYLFMNSFYNISGAMGTLDTEIRTFASIRQPIMISGESGTGKEQIARFLYLHSSLANKPFVSINCKQINEKSWNFLLNHYNSPLNATGNTLYFQNLESLSESMTNELLTAIQETGLSRRIRLIFSCTYKEDEGVPKIMKQFLTKLGCLLLNLPSLRSRADEIPSLASLYLSNINQELGKQISGFEPKAIEMLRQYDWPNNYTQFKHTLQTLAALTHSAYIRSTIVAELLARERSLRHSSAPATASPDNDRTLDEIIGDVVRQTITSCGGNRTAAARKLGISRTTLWRYLSKSEGTISSPDI